MPRSGENTRKAILDAANQIVQERGVDHLTLKLTAQEAGVSKGGLLHHFPNKEALIQGMIQDYLDRFTADFNQASEQHGPETSGRWTRAYLHTTLEDHRRTPRMSSGLLAGVAINPDLLAPMQETFKEWVKLLDEDGIDPVVATIIRLAVDGLWMVKLFGLAAPDKEMQENILKFLDRLIDQSALKGAP